MELRIRKSRRTQMKQLLKKLTHGKRRTGAAPSALAFADAAAAEDYLKALAPIFVRVEGRLTVLRLLQP